MVPHKKLSSLLQRSLNLSHIQLPAAFSLGGDTNMLIRVRFMPKIVSYLKASSIEMLQG